LLLETSRCCRIAEQTVGLLLAVSVILPTR
jgi:hypothetical protein